MIVGTETRKPHLPRVSVIIPTYNRSELLRVAIESVLAQTYPNVEIIVVDDGSADDTAAVMAQYAGRVTYLKQANQNVAAARNTGIRVASGEYLSFLDDDDLILPTKIARQVQVLASRSEAGLVHCRYYPLPLVGTCGCVCENTFCVSNMPCRISEVTKKTAF